MAQTAVIIVTHNSAKVLESCLAALAKQSVLPEVICIVDSGSTDAGYLHAAEKEKNVIILHQKENIGFAGGNNYGFSHIKDDFDYLLFINPDTILEKDGIKRAVGLMQENDEIGMLTGRLLGFDFASQKPTGFLDSTGIFRKWYGRWYDRGQGEIDRQQYSRAEDIPAACGALMFCRKKALDQVILAGRAVFDPAFFMYKEDIELCLRIRKAGWKIRYEPQIIGFHGRGWQPQRNKMSLAVRKISARNELLLYSRHPSPYITWALVKYVLVFLFRV